MSEQLKAAILRGAYSAVGTFLITWLGALAVDTDPQKALIAGGIAALTILGFRGGVEGTYDTARQRAGDVKPSDVTPAVPESEWGIHNQ